MDLKVPALDNEEKLNQHSFGPSFTQRYLPQKSTLLELERKDLRVSFKETTEVIVVENWKKYNVDVSTQIYQSSQDSKTKCLDICSVQ